MGTVKVIPAHLYLLVPQCSCHSDAERIKASYESMRPIYCRYECDSFLFDAELAERVITKMKRGKAADL